MEASAVRAPAALGRLSIGGPLLRLRSDEQLVAHFRAGSEEAFAVIHDRYRQRLFAYVRQMLSGASRQDSEDVLQDVFMRAYSALRNDERELNLKAWLYRVAHNRCIDHVRRPTPQAADVFEMSRTPLVDPMESAQRREDLRRLVADVGRLPEQQRSALLMREIDGLAYADIAAALSVTVPAVKSLLVRARIGLAEAAEARATDCGVIRADLAGSYDRGVKASGRARRHMRECSGCREFKTSLRSMRRQFAALSPIGAAGPLALAAKAFGFGGAGGGAAATAGGGAAVVGTATACKVAAVVCTAAIATGGAVEVKERVTERQDARPALGIAAKSAAVQSAALSASAPERVFPAAADDRIDRRASRPASRKRKAAVPAPSVDPVAADPVVPVAETPDLAATTGGAAAPVDTESPASAIEPLRGVMTPAPTEEGNSSEGSGAPAQDPTPEDTSSSGGAASAK